MRAPSLSRSSKPALSKPTANVRDVARQPRLPSLSHHALVRSLDDTVESWFWWVARRAYGRTIAVIAGSCYLGIGLAAPILLGWPVSWLVTANIIGTALAGSLILFWFVVLVQRAQRRHLVEWTTDLRHLSSTEFEWFVGELLRREGWTVEEIGQPGAPDGGVDLVIRRGKEKALVQCKRWESKHVGVELVRAFAGVVAREGASTNSSIFVTLSEFTPFAVDEAGRLGITLWDHRDLFTRAEQQRRPDPCPVCGDPMLLDRSARGWWFRCVRPSCSGKRDIGRDPAVAVELLTLPPDPD